MKIFITGATGYIGSAVAEALRRAGHEVWGLIRDPDKTGPLHRAEVRTIIGSLQQPEKFMNKARECDVLIHAAADLEAGMAATDPELIRNFITAANGNPSKKIVYTSGVWVYGDTKEHRVDETPALNPPKHVAWRPAVEQMVLDASSRSMVIRPGCVYGKRGGLTGMWFQGAEKGKVKIIGDGKNHWTMIHVDDLADAYVHAIESDFSGEIFNVTDNSALSVTEMVKAAFRATGNKESFRLVPLEEAAKTMGGFAECLALDQHVDSTKAHRMLGWKPKHADFATDAETHYMAWKQYKK